MSSLALAATPPLPPANLCVDNNCTATAPSGSFIKWHPGHGLKTQGYDSASIASQLTKVNDSPYITFAKIHYQWGDLETSKGVYDFSAIRKHYDYLAARGKRMIIAIDDKKFATTNPDGLVPAYLSSDAVPSNNGFVAATWRANVMDRYIALLDAIAKQFDDEPYFEGVATQESVPSFGGVDAPADYSAGALATQRKRFVTAATQSYKHTNVFSMVNFLGGFEADVIAQAYDSRAGTGGPDVLRKNMTTGQEVMYGVSGGVDYRGKMPIHFVASTPTFDYGDARAVYDDSFKNKTTHLAWVSTDSTVSWNSILSVLSAEGGRIYSNCPTNYNGACDTK